MTIPIRNLYYLLCYAWRRLPDSGIGDHGQEAGKDLADLFARFLTHGVLALVKRGLDRTYVDVVEEISTLRGRGLWIQTAQALSLQRGRVICEYQELSSDTRPNQVIKAGLRLLERHADLNMELLKKVRLCLGFLGEVKDIPLNEEVFRTIQVYQGLRGYAWLLDACRLLARWSFPDEKGGVRFRDIVRDETEMARLFEQFVRGFYQINPTGFSLGRRHLQWRWVAQSEEASALVPRMETDVTLRRVNEVVVIDTKYYASALTTPTERRKETLISGNLYQMHAYLTSFAATGVFPLTGILLYPKMDREIHLEFRHDDYCLRVETLDLSREWKDIHDALLNLVPKVSALPG